MISADDVYKSSCRTARIEKRKELVAVSCNFL